MTSHQIKHALDLMRRLPPQQAQRNLNDLACLVPRIDEDLFFHLDQPLRIGRDRETGKNYILCCYNKDGNSYRSPWSNTYTPFIADGALPSKQLRRLEVEANYAFDQYRELYFQGGVSSVYFWDTSDGFAGAVLIKNDGNGSNQATGFWDSTHIVEVHEQKNGTFAHYRLTSSVMLWLQTSERGSGNTNLGATLTRRVEIDAAVTPASSHINNIGRLVEEVENRIRNELIEIYFAKIKNITNSLRSSQQLTKHRIVPYGILRAIQDAD